MVKDKWSKSNWHGQGIWRCMLGGMQRRCQQRKKPAEFVGTGTVAGGGREGKGMHEGLAQQELLF